MSDEDELVTALETGDAGLVMLVRSMLEDAEVPCVVQGDAVQELFNLGRFGTGFNPLAGPVRILVRRCDESTARELLRQTTPLAEDDEGHA